MRRKSEWERQKVVHAERPLVRDPTFEADLSAYLRETLGPDRLVDLYGRFAVGAGALDGLMRRAVWRALARSFGHAVVIAPGAMFRHLERIEIGDGVFFGEQSLLQGRYDGTCVIGNRVWIGPQAFLDARNLQIDEAVGIGPGARILGAEHAEEPIAREIIANDQLVEPVRIGRGALIGTGSVVLPGVSIGALAIVGAGAVVTGDVADSAVVAGVPARMIRSRGLTKEATSGS